MKLNSTNKIILGIAIGGGIAWLMSRKKSASTNASTTSGTKEEPLTRDDKINFIIDNIVPSENEEQTGFSGERFEYDPKLGYALPFGTVQITNSGDEVTLPREGDLAQEVFFNAEGDLTADPTEEAESILNSLTDEELNVAYKIAKAKRKFGMVARKDLKRLANVGDRGIKLFDDVVKSSLNDIKALTKTPNWSKGRERRRKMRMMSPEDRKAYKMARREKRKNRKNRKAKNKVAIARRCYMLTDNKKDFVACMRKYNAKKG